MKNIAVIGHGFLGKWHTEKVAQNKNVNLYSVIEANKDVHQELQNKYPKSLILSNVKDLELDKVDAVIISTPTSTHFELAKFFLENKKHVFCEKPLCATTDEAVQLGELLEPKVVLQVGHSERYHPIWKKFKEDLAQTSGPYSIKIDRLAPFKGRATDVDVVQDLMIHDLDLVQFLFTNLEIEKFNSIGFKQRTNHADYGETQISFTDGSRATLSVGRNYVIEKRMFEVNCQQGTFQVDLLNGVYLKALAEFNDEFVVKTEYTKADHLKLEQDAFFAAVDGQGDNLVDYQAGLNAVRMVDMVRDQIHE